MRYGVILIGFVFNVDCMVAIGFADFEFNIELILACLLVCVAIS